MNTPAHVVVAMAALARPGDLRRNVSAVVGALAPDVSLYLLVSWSLFVQGISPQVVFDELYFSAAWQAVFAVDNSVFVWLGLGFVGFLLRWPVLIVMAMAALSHIALDLPLHHDDGRPHFWPMSDWVFESPLSYWDPRAHGRLIGGLEVLMCLVLLAVLWRRFRSRLSRAAIALVAVALAAPGVMFAIMLG